MAEFKNEFQNDRNKSKSGVIAQILFLVAVIVAIILLARACSNNKTQLEKTRVSMIRERDSLLREMKNTQDKYITVLKEKEYLNKSLSDETENNRQLQAEKTGGLYQLARSKKKIAEQTERMKSLAGLNDSLIITITGLQGKMADLNKKIDEKSRELEGKDKDLSRINDSLNNKTSEVARINTAFEDQRMTDSIKYLPKFVTGVELIGGYGLNTTNIPYARNLLGPNVFAGFEFNRRFMAGFGTGAHIFNGGTLMPIFLEFRYGFEAENYTPYIFSRGGPLLHFDSYAQSNLFLNAGIGMRHQISQNLAWNMGAGLYSHSSGISGRDSFITLDFGLIFSQKDKTEKKK